MQSSDVIVSHGAHVVIGRPPQIDPHIFLTASLRQLAFAQQGANGGNKQLAFSQQNSREKAID